MDRTSWKPKIYKATEAVDYKANEEGTSDGAKKGWLTRQRGGSAEEPKKDFTPIDWAGQVGATKSEADQDKASDLMDKYYELVNEPMEDLPSDGSAMEERRSIHAKGIADFKAYLESSGSATVNQDVTDILEDENYHSLNKMLTKEEPTNVAESPSTVFHATTRTKDNLDTADASNYQQSSRDKEFYDETSKNTLDTLNQSKVNGFPFFSYVGQPKQVISDGKGGIILYGMKRNPNSIRRVDVKYDEGRDTYSVSFMSNRNKPKGEYNDVYFDQLSGLIAGNKGLGVESKANELKTYNNYNGKLNQEAQDVLRQWVSTLNHSSEVDFYNIPQDVLDTVNKYTSDWMEVETFIDTISYYEEDIGGMESKANEDDHKKSWDELDSIAKKGFSDIGYDQKSWDSEPEEVRAEMETVVKDNLGENWKVVANKFYKEELNKGKKSGGESRIDELHGELVEGEFWDSGWQWKCDHCSGFKLGSEFGSDQIRLIEDHLKSSHGITEAKLKAGYVQCPHCSTQMSRLDWLQDHIKTSHPTKASESVLEKVNLNGWEFSVIDNGYGGGSFGSTPNHGLLEVGIFAPKSGSKTMAGDSEIKGWLTPEEVEDLKRTFEVDPVMAYRRIGGDWEEDWQKGLESLASESKLKANEEGVNDWWDRVTTDGSDLDRMWRGTHFNEIPIEHQNHYFSLYMEELSADKYGDHMAMHNATDFSHPAMYKHERGNYGGWQVEDSLHSGNTTNPFASQNDTISLNGLSADDELDPFGNRGYDMAGEGRKAELNKEINKLVKFIEIASVENPMHMSEYMQELEELKTERESLGESAYGHGSATGRMSPRDSWEQGYLADGTLGGGRMDPMFHDFRTMHWSELPSDIQEAWKAQGGYYSTGEGLVDNIEKQLNRFGVNLDRDPDQVEESKANEYDCESCGGEYSNCPHCGHAMHDYEWEDSNDVCDSCEKGKYDESYSREGHRHRWVKEDETDFCLDCDEMRPTEYEMGAKGYDHGESKATEGFDQGLYGHVDAKCKTCGVEFDSIPDMDDHYAMHSDHVSNLDDLDSDIPNSD